MHGVQFKMRPNNSHLLRYKNEIRSRSTPAAHASCAKTVQVRTWCVHEQNVCSFSNITSHRKCLLLFVKHLALHFLIRE
jgi:hypothetical protein